MEESASYPASMAETTAEEDKPLECMEAESEPLIPASSEGINTMSLETLYHQTNGLVQTTQGSFQTLERCGDAEAQQLEREIQARIDTITSNCERLDLLVIKEPVSRRQIARTRVEQLRYDNQHLQAALRMMQHRRQQSAQESWDREQLLATSFSPSSDSETAILIDHSLNHNNALQRANRGVDDMLFTGNSALENLRDQRSTLKGAQKRLMDVANTLGLSNTTMRLIESRVKQDKFILFGGMALTLIIILVVYLYVLRK